MIIGTGTGGGIVVDGHVIEGRNRIAGEWGHNPLPWPCDDERPGPPCYCGRTGCIETFLSGGGLSATYAAVAKADLAANDVARLAAGGDRLAARALDIYEERLARALASIINVLDPDVIVLGGGLSNIDRLYANVPARWKRFVFSDDRPILRSCRRCTATRAACAAPHGSGGTTMMKIRVSSAVLLALALSWTVLAQAPLPMREGNWEVTVKMSMEGMKMDMPPMKQHAVHHCRDGEGPAGRDAEGPRGQRLQDHRLQGSGGSVTYKMACTKPSPMTAVAEMKFTGTDAYTGTMAMEGEGHKMVMTLDAKRLGDCPK